ncbi:hypothetical protein D0Y65_025606 [Glycine soja]|uniref:Uncharacterized protein n=1 Tax=Glycine soja TaxID=3848 RepID=A0A445IGM7_GLYSO|nr:hypothetical protein D0Y65_025606 [Glycine soja]
MLRRRRETEPGEKRVKVAAVGDGSKGDEAKRVRARKTRELEKECETLSILVAVQDPLKRQSPSVNPADPNQGASNANVNHVEPNQGNSSSSVDPAQAKKVAASSIVILNQAKDVAANSSVIPPPKPMNSACDHKTKVPIVVG